MKLSAPWVPSDEFELSLHPKAERILSRHHPDLMEELFDLLRELFKENPPVIANERGLLEGGGGGGGGAARKREWVAQRVAELSEVVGCMVIASYHRYRVRGGEGRGVCVSYACSVGVAMPRAVAVCWMGNGFVTVEDADHRYMRVMTRVGF